MAAHEAENDQNNLNVQNEEPGPEAQNEQNIPEAAAQDAQNPPEGPVGAKLIKSLIISTIGIASLLFSLPNLSPEEKTNIMTLCLVSLMLVIFYNVNGFHYQPRLRD